MPFSREEPASASNKTIAKQRKLRKGTHSCWECKRRKARCVFSAGDDAMCVGCRRRGTKCVNQNENDQEPESREGVTNRRLQRIEAMLETILERQGGDGEKTAVPVCERSPELGLDMLHREMIYHETQSPPHENRAPSTTTSRLRLRHASPVQRSIPKGLSNTLSKTLYNLLPPAEECRKICSSIKFVPCFFQQMLTRDWKTISASPELPIITPNRLAKMPNPDVHPILIAQKMMMLACLAQFVYRESNDSEWKNRAEIMASAAVDVVAKEQLCHNAEGLECLMLEGTYHANNGDMRRAFSAVRRAIAIGQLMGIHGSHSPSILQLDKSAPPFDPAYMWYRIISTDRLFSLVLGLPQGCSTARIFHRIISTESDPEEQLERQHSEIASWILDRNERDLDSINETQIIDQALQDASSVLPSTWWLPPTLSQIASRRDMFLSTTRLVNQILHFNLIVQTHLPYLHQDGPLYGYNKAACATASREVLVRYHILQDSGFVAHTSHIVEFFSLMAAIALTLTHLERLWQDNSQELSVLAHTRSGDRALVEQTKTTMARLPACKGAQILHHLLQIEDEAYHTRSVGSGTIIKDFPDQGPLFELRIPYFGQLRLNSAKLCFQRVTDIQDVCISVKHVGECAEEIALGELDFRAFEGGGRVLGTF